MTRPVLVLSALQMRFWSSLTLPGQAYAVRAAIAAGESVAPAYESLPEENDGPAARYLQLAPFWDPDIKGIPTRPELIQGSHGHPDIPAVALLPASMDFEPELPVSTVTLGRILLAYLLRA